MIVSGKLYEVPTDLIGKQVMLLNHEHDPQRIEVLFEERSWGGLVQLNLHANNRVRRPGGRRTEVERPAPSTTDTDTAASPSASAAAAFYRSGRLFDGRAGS